MNRHDTRNDAFPRPLQPNRTVRHLLEWIGDTDEGCHDPRALVVLRAIDRSLVPSVASPAAAVMLVRALAIRVSANPALGERLLAEFVEEPPPVTVERARTLATV